MAMIANMQFDFCVNFLDFLQEFLQTFLRIQLLESENFKLKISFICNNSIDYELQSFPQEEYL